MYRPSFIERCHWIVIAGTVGLTICYLLAFRPLSSRSASLDKSLQEAWSKLAAINVRYQGNVGMDLDTVKNSHLLAEKMERAMKRVSTRVRQRIALDHEMREKLRQPFLLLDFEERRQRMIDELRQQASEKGVTLDSSISSAFPIFGSASESGDTLWAQLAIFDQVLRTAVGTSPTAIKSAVLLPTKKYPADDTNQAFLQEFPVRIRMSGAMETVLNFLMSLPLLPDEVRQLHLPPVTPNKPALFLERLILKSARPDPNEVELEAVVSGLVSREVSVE